MGQTMREFANELQEENAMEWEPGWGDYEEEGFDSEEAYIIQEVKRRIQ